MSERAGERINLARLRTACGGGETWIDVGEAVISPASLLALVEAVAAAHTLASENLGGAAHYGRREKLREALARFDFDEPT